MFLVKKFPELFNTVFYKLSIQTLFIKVSIAITTCRSNKNNFVPKRLGCIETKQQ